MVIATIGTQQTSTQIIERSIHPLTRISPDTSPRRVSARRGGIYEGIFETMASSDTPARTQREEEKRMPDTISLLIADDYAIIRRGIRVSIERQPDLQIVGEVDSGEAAVRLAAEIEPNVVLMDLVMPGIGGIKATHQLKLASPRSQVIILSAHDEDEFIIPALQAGALSYLLKDISTDRLTKAVRKAAHSESVLHPRVASRLLQILSNPKSHSPNSSTDLSAREEEVLRLLTNELSNEDIAYKLCISEKEVKTHVSSIIRKLRMLNYTQVRPHS